MEFGQQTVDAFSVFASGITIAIFLFGLIAFFVNNRRLRSRNERKMRYILTSFNNNILEGLIKQGYASGKILESEVKCFLRSLETTVPDFESKDGIFKPLEKYISLQEEAHYFEWLEKAAVGVTAYGLWLLMILLIE